MRKENNSGKKTEAEDMKDKEPKKKMEKAKSEEDS